jgi:Na+/H+ antiporter NhaD/arsenite permease-like protein
VTHFISIAALVAVFAIATVRPINMGILAFLAAFLVGGVVSGISVDDITSFFPGDMFLVVFGITLLFGLARANGSLDVIMHVCLGLVRGKRWAIVWLMFLLAAALMSLGSVLAVGMLAPIAMPLAKRYNIRPLLMGMMLSHGMLGAAFSPITVYAVGIQGLLEDQPFSVSPLTLFLVPFLLNLVLAVVAFLVLGGRDLFRDQTVIEQEELVAVGAVGTPPSAGATGRVGGALASGGSATGRGGRSAGGSGGDDTPRGTGPASVIEGSLDLQPATAVTVEHWITFASIVGLLVAAVFGIDVGVAATCIGAVLLLAFPRHVEGTMKAVAWPAVLLVCGVVTYMGVLKANGTIEYLGEKATELPWPLLTALVLLFAVGLISAVGSSFGIILIALPLAAPLLEAGQLSAAAFIIALGFCATVVDVSPFSSNGVIVLATAQVDDKQGFQKQMLRYTAYIAVVAPLLALAALVLPTSL